MARKASSPPTRGRRPAPRRRDEVLEFEGQSIARFPMDFVHSQDLAEEVILDRGRLVQVHAVQVEAASLELFQGSNQGRLLGSEVEQRVALRAPDPHLPHGRVAWRGWPSHSPRCRLLNSIRAFATSSCSPNKLRPTAATDRTGAWIMERSKSRSWIIKSKTTPISVDRNV